MNTHTGATEREWISIPQAAKLAGLSADILKKLVKQKRFTIRQMPGCQVRISRIEVLQMVMACTRPPSRPSLVDRFKTSPKASV